MEPLAAIETFGKYHLLATIARGGMATIYLAVQQGIEGFVKVFALKRVLPRLAASRQGVEMFLEEARLAARLDHPNIVGTYDLGQVGRDYFISMEYVPGEDVRAIIRQVHKAAHRVPVEIVAAIIKQCANGLHHAHELRGQDDRPLGIVHRDVSPSNVLVSYHGAVKVVDFGIARGEKRSAEIRPFQGKVAHSAPEQIEGGAIDRRTDVFCLGILAWELLAGTRLFKGATAEEVAGAVFTTEIPAPSTVRSDVPEAIDALVRRAVQRRPEDRHQSAAEVYEAIDAWERTGVRATEKTLASWLEQLFGSERAELKKGIAQGRNLERLIPAAATLLAPGPEPRPTPSIPPIVSVPIPAEAPTPYELPAARIALPALKPWPAWSTGLAGAVAAKPPILRVATGKWSPPVIQPEARRSLVPPRVSLAPEPQKERPLIDAVSERVGKPRLAWAVIATVLALFATALILLAGSR